jgi:hypothetical protein
LPDMTLMFSKQNGPPPGELDTHKNLPLSTTT